LGDNRNIEAALSIYPALAAPIESSGILFNGGVDAQIWTLPTAGLPPLAPQGISTVTRKQPHIPQVENNRHLMAERNQKTQIEIASMQVVSVDDIRAIGNQVQ
jgi:hypothetical protein